MSPSDIVDWTMAIFIVGMAVSVLSLMAGLVYYFFKGN